MKRFKIEELEGKALENALQNTAMYNDIDFEDADEQYDELVGIANENRYEFNEEGERVTFYKGMWMTFTDYAMVYGRI